MNIEDIRVGLRVRVKAKQQIIGPARYPGRVGVILRQNPMGGSEAGGMWYVRLDATERAKERIEPFFGRDLEPEA